MARCAALIPALACLWIACGVAHGDTHVYTAHDAPMRHVPADLAWTPGPFEIANHDAAEPAAYDAVVSFPSPTPTGVEALDRVTMWWYRARDAQGEAIEGPALLLVHSLHPRMPIAQALASDLSRQGIHCFIVHLPGYAGRDDGSRRFPGVVALLHGRQGVADVRRARDAIVVLPGVTGEVALQGTSLGGFVASVVAGLDGGAFSPVFLLLSGADAALVLREGEADAARMRQRMADEGYDDAALAALLAPLEPMRFVRRLDPADTYLYSARFDQVVPPAATAQLTDALALDEAHHRWYDGDHYTAVMFLPGIAQHIAAVMHAKTPPDVTNPENAER